MVFPELFVNGKPIQGDIGAKNEVLAAICSSFT